MVKRKSTRRRYKNKLLIRALNAEARVKVLHDAAVRCMRDRDAHIQSLSVTATGLEKMLGMLIEKTKGQKIVLAREEFNSEKHYDIIIEEHEKELHLVLRPENSEAPRKG